jgi:hypothetical protein
VRGEGGVVDDVVVLVVSLFGWVGGGFPVVPSLFRWSSGVGEDVPLNAARGGGAMAVRPGVRAILLFAETVCEDEDAVLPRTMREGELVTPRGLRDGEPGGPRALSGGLIA